MPTLPLENGFLQSLSASQPAGVDFSRNHTVWSRYGMVEVSQIGHGESILVLPGMAGGARLLQPLISQLATQYRVYWFDWAGEGKSSSIQALRINDHPTRILADVIDQLPVDELTVFGISYGGCVALDLARHRPAKVNQMILSGTPGRLQHAWASRLVHKVLTRVPLCSDSAFLNQFFRILLGDGVRNAEVESFVIDCIWKTDQALMARRLDWLMDFDIHDSLAGIEVPTTLITGGSDVVVPPACQEKLANAMPECDMHLVSGAGHLGFLTHTNEFLACIGRAMAQKNFAAIG